MAETLIEKGICGACGTSVRDGSSFCFNCGESIVASEPPPPAIRKPSSGFSNGRNPRTSEPVAFPDSEPAPVVRPRASLEHISAPPHEPEAARRTDVIRPRERTRIKRTVEVEWVERSSSSARFVITAIIFAMIAGALLAAALYLK